MPVARGINSKTILENDIYEKLAKSTHFVLSEFLKLNMFSKCISFLSGFRAQHDQFHRKQT